MARRRIASWRAKAGCIARACVSQRLVLPSMSLNRKVTVPVGKLVTGGLSHAERAEINGYGRKAIRPLYPAIIPPAWAGTGQTPPNAQGGCKLRLQCEVIGL